MISVKRVLNTDSINLLFTLIFALAVKQHLHQGNTGFSWKDNTTVGLSVPSEFTDFP